MLVLEYLPSRTKTLKVNKSSTLILKQKGKVVYKLSFALVSYMVSSISYMKLSFPQKLELLYIYIYIYIYIERERERERERYIYIYIYILAWTRRYTSTDVKWIRQ